MDERKSNGTKDPVNKINILVVDDRPEGLMAVEAVLNSDQYNIMTAPSGSEALKHLLANDFAVILLDVQMPIMNGFETASVIKTREKSRDIPIIFMSAINQDEQYVYQGYGVGAVDYILKPFDPYILRSKVAIFADLYRKNQLIKEQSQKLREHENKLHAQKVNQIEVENLRRYQNLADSIPQIVFRLKPDGEYEYFNRVWFDYTGLSVNSCFGHSWKSVIHPHDVEKLNELFTTAEVKDCECRILNKNGEFRWHLFRVEQESVYQTGGLQHWLGTATDIQDRKQAEEEQRFLSEAGEVLVSTLDFQEGLEKIARLAVPFIGDWIAFEVLDEEEKPRTRLLYHRDPKCHEKSLEFYSKYLNSPASEYGTHTIFREGKMQVLQQNELDDKSGIFVPLCLHKKTIGVLTLVSDSGKTFDESTLKLLSELTRRISLALENFRLYKISQDAIEVRNEFLSIASHELNTPITSLKLQLQMVKKTLLAGQEGNLPVDRFTRSVNASVKQVDRLINLIQILLDVSRIQSGKFTFNFQNVRVPEIIDEVVERHREILEISDCNLTVKPLPDLEVVWDKTRVEQVITNILTNAIKYAPGDIEISAEEENGNIVFRVTDHGDGIPEDKLRTIFDRFERATTKENVSGLGLGLFIVKQIVEGHHGHVDVKSSDKGTEFKVTLPKVVTEESKPYPDSPENEQFH